MPYQSRNAGRLADLIMRQGDIAADRAQRSGDVWANVARGLGSIPAGIQAQRAADAEAMQKRRLFDSQMANADLQRQNTQGEIEERGRQRTQQDEARALAKRTQKVTEWLGDVASSPDQETQQASYRAGRERLLSEGTLTAEDAPDFFPGQSWVKSRMAMLLPAAERFKQMFPEPKAPIQRDPTKDLVNPETLEVVMPGTPEVKRHKVTVPGPGGIPVEKLVTEDELAQGVTAYREPKQQPQGPQPGWQWVIRDGKEVYTNKVEPGDRPQNVRVKPREDELKTAGFYGQMADAMRVIDELEDKLTAKELYQIQSLPQEDLIGMANRNALSENAKRYLRAFEQFTESRLRPVSGAAIVDSEYARDRRTYAKQYGETPKLAADRRRARGGALVALKKRAGAALDEQQAGGDSGGLPEGTEGTVNGVPAVWKTVDGKAGWYER